MLHNKEGKPVAQAAAESGMSPNTASKYLKAGKLPSEMKKERHWRTHPDAFSEVWEEAKELLGGGPQLEAKALFDYLQREYPGQFQDSQLRTFQRRVKKWRIEEGPPQEVIFPQEHSPGELSASDFTSMNKLGIRIGGEEFPHLLFHFVLTWSNWEWVSVCQSESYEALQAGLQESLWECGGVTAGHRTDCLTAAVKDLNKQGEDFTRRYKGLLSHYGMSPEHTNPASPHENGDIESRHGHLKKALENALIIRGSREFSTLEEYRKFLRKNLRRLNANRSERFTEESKTLRKLPRRKMDACSRKKVRVRCSSTIRVQKNTYSVPSRLRGERVDVKIYPDHLEVYAGRTCLQRMERLRGEGKCNINYRHIIDSLVRKPGAFASYTFRSELFPTSRFRIAYDMLKKRYNGTADKKYLNILYLAARRNEAGIDRLLGECIDKDEVPEAETLKKQLETLTAPPGPPDVDVKEADLDDYDSLTGGGSSNE